MLRCILLLLLFCLLHISTALAEVFIVTSNADSGPGTLREALIKAAANGTTDKDYIHFNLPDVSEAGRTIVIKSELPFVTTNTVIDASTQPGAYLGVSQAKVTLSVDRTTYMLPLAHYTYTGIFILKNCKDVEVYGFNFINCRYLRGPVLHGGTNYCVGVFLDECTDIIIGAPNKGNVFNNNAYAIICSRSSGVASYPAWSYRIKIQSNFIGLSTDGINALNDNWGDFLYGITLYADDVQIGGDNANERNYFGSLTPSLWFGGRNINIINNNFAVSYFGNRLSYNTPNGVTIINSCVMLSCDYA